MRGDHHINRPLVRRTANLSAFRYRIIAFLSILGPGFITANVDNDPGGILTYSQAGAKYGYALLWTLIPTTLALIVIQEMAARMGAVTGKGLSDLIREEFGFRMTFWLMLALVITNFGNVVAEFAGVASSLEIFGISRYIVVPIAAAVVWLMVVKGTYESVEKIFLAASMFYVAYIVAGLLAHPDWKAAAVATVSRPSGVGINNYGYLFMVVGLVGTTIAPWMQFYLQASIVEKGVTAKQYRTSRWDVILGCLFTDVVAWFIIVACAATLWSAGATISTAADAARAAGAGGAAPFLVGAPFHEAPLAVGAAHQRVGVRGSPERGDERAGQRHCREPEEADGGDGGAKHGSHGNSFLRFGEGQSSKSAA